MDESRDWLRELEKMNLAEYYPYFNDMAELIRKGRQLTLQLIEVDRLETYLVEAKGWKERTSRVFLYKNSPVDLMEALTPRTFKNYMKEKYGTYHLTSEMKPVTAVAEFKEAELKEIEFIETLRSKNANKSIDSDSTETFCVCKRGPYGIMMRCELCRDWFHSTCVQLPKIALLKYKGSFLSLALHFRFEDCRFVCPNCHRTKRPRLDAILLLLMSLQKLHVRVPEGEALQSLTERALNWQDCAQQLLQNYQLVQVNNEFDKLFQKFEGKDSVASRRDPMGELTDSIPLSRFKKAKYKFHLSYEVKQKVNEMLLKSDLLEVSVDDTFQLWKWLQLSRDFDKEPSLIVFDSYITNPPRRLHMFDFEGEIRKRTTENERRTRPPKNEDTTTRQEDEGTSGLKVVERESCAVPFCLNPSGNNVDWVQCDGGCNRWFHMTCVGIVAEDLKDDEDYVCILCCWNIVQSP